MISIKQDRINEYPIPRTMKAWVLGNPEELALVEKPVPEPGAAEVLVRVCVQQKLACSAGDKPAGVEVRAP
jgi:hypothetical protein